jgi:hypothetical protein
MVKAVSVFDCVCVPGYKGISHRTVCLAVIVSIAR